jgi:hypothetical protein
VLEKTDKDEAKKSGLKHCQHSVPLFLAFFMGLSGERVPLITRAPRFDSGEVQEGGALLETSGAATCRMDGTDAPPIQARILRRGEGTWQRKK